MKFDAITMAQPARRVPPLVHDVEAAGFDGLWFTESGRTAYTGCTAAALTAERLDIGTAVALAFPRSPMVTAQIAWELADATHGRFILGLGTQVRAHIERRFGMAWGPPVPRLREYVQVLRAAWRSWQDGTPLRVEGAHYRITLMGPFFDPGPNPEPRIPVFIAGVNRLLCQLAGELGDGFIVHPMHSVEYLRKAVLPNIAVGLARSRRSRGDMTLYAPVFLAPGESAAEVAAAVARARVRMAFYGSTPSYRPLLEVLGYGDVADRLRLMVRERQTEALAAQLPDAVVDAVVVRGSYEEIGRALRRRYEGLVDRVASYWPFTPADRAGWERLARAFRGG